MGAGLLYCLHRNGYQEPFGGKHGAGKSMKDLECKPPIFFGMRPPSVGILERSMPVCEGAKGTCPKLYQYIKAFTQACPKNFSAFSDACWLASWADVLILTRALSERSELVRSPKVSVRPIRCGQTGRQWFWVLLPKQKGLGCRAETRQYKK